MKIKQRCMILVLLFILTLSACSRPRVDVADDAKENSSYSAEYEDTKTTENNESIENTEEPDSLEVTGASDKTTEVEPTEDTEATEKTDSTENTEEPDSLEVTDTSDATTAVETTEHEVSTETIETQTPWRVDAGELSADKYLAKVSLEVFMDLMNSRSSFENGVNFTVSISELLKQVEDEEGRENAAEILEGMGVSKEFAEQVLAVNDKIRIPDDSSGKAALQCKQKPVMRKMDEIRDGDDGVKEYIKKFEAGWGGVYHNSERRSSFKCIEDAAEQIHIFEGETKILDEPVYVFGIEPRSFLRNCWTQTAIPYESHVGEYEFMTIIPDEGHTFQEVLSIIIDDPSLLGYLDEDFEYLRFEPTFCSIPVFSVNNKMNVSKYMNMSDQSVYQTIQFSFDDAGTERASANEYDEHNAGFDEWYHSRRVLHDRPFLFFVVHVETGIPVICGYLGDLE